MFSIIILPAFFFHDGSHTHRCPQYLIYRDAELRQILNYRAYVEILVEKNCNR